MISLRGCHGGPFHEIMTLAMENIMTKIKYEPHPVTPERKKELVAQGFKIIDARFAPPDEATDEVSRESIAKMKKADVVEMLAAHGVEDAEGSVADLREKLIAVMFLDG